MRQVTVILALFFAACSPGPENTSDTGYDAAPDQSTVSDADVSTDAEPDEDAPDDVRPEEDAGSDALADADSEADAADNGTVSVLTINLWNAYVNRDDYEQRTQMVADFIEARQPDFVAVQEAVENDDITNRVDVLARMTDYEGVYEMTHDVPFTFEEGIGVLTRWPVVESEAMELRHGDLFGATQRKVLGVQVDRNGTNTWFFSTHMTVEPDQDKKADQAADVFSFLEERASGATFVAGDMNAEPDTTAMQFLRGESEWEGSRGDLQDAWLVTNPDADGFTNPSEDPDKRIDYVYSRDATPESCRIVLNQPQNGVYASDHLGVLCNFTVR